MPPHEDNKPTPLPWWDERATEDVDTSLPHPMGRADEDMVTLPPRREPEKNLPAVASESSDGDHDVPLALEEVTSSRSADAVLQESSMASSPQAVSNTQKHRQTSSGAKHTKNINNHNTTTEADPHEGLKRLPGRGLKPDAIGKNHPRRRYGLLGFIPSMWLLNGYRTLPFGITSAMLACLLFWAIIVAAWSVIPLPPFQWVVQSQVLETETIEQVGVVQPVWWSLQPVLAVCIGALLGGRWAVLLYGVYLLGGLLGVPWFATGGGPSYLLQPSAGYLLGLFAASVLSGWVFNFATVSRRPKSARAIKLRQRAEYAKQLRQRHNKGRFEELVTGAVRLLMALRPHPSRNICWFRWVARTVCLSAGCVLVVHGVGMSVLWGQHWVGLLSDGAYAQKLYDYTEAVWPYDVLAGMSILLILLAVKALLNPIYHVPLKVRRRQQALTAMPTEPEHTAV